MDFMINKIKALEEEVAELKLINLRMEVENLKSLPISPLGLKTQASF